MAVKTKKTKKSKQKEQKMKDFHMIGKNQNDLKMIVYGDGVENNGYISFFALIIINGLQISGSLKLSTIEGKDSFFSWPAYGKKTEDGSTEWIKQVSVKDDGLKEDLAEFIQLVEDGVEV